ncbi:unnamed protein product, partial [Ixodes hexagonus]
QCCLSRSVLVYVESGSACRAVCSFFHFHTQKASYIRVYSPQPLFLQPFLSRHLHIPGPPQKLECQAWSSLGQQDEQTR